MSLKFFQPVDRDLIDGFYQSLLAHILRVGTLDANRTGVDTIKTFGLSREFSLDPFPILSWKAVPWKVCFNEMLGFLRGYNNAAQFRELGVKIWDANANDNIAWCQNPQRTGHDDLGRIYGVQARRWLGPEGWHDQLATIYDKLKAGVDDRRLIVSHWNPGELDQMALPPCHMFYQFNLRPPVPGDEIYGLNDFHLDLLVYVRSNDVGLGLPFNIAGYAWLLATMAWLTGHTPGRLTYVAGNVHIYTNHIAPLKERLGASIEYPPHLPRLVFTKPAPTLEELTNAAPEDDYYQAQDFCTLENYKPWPAIPLEMAV